MVIIKALVTCMNDLLSILALQNNTLKQNASVVARVASSANQQEHKNTQRGSGSLHHHLWKNLKSQELLHTQGGTTTWGKKSFFNRHGRNYCTCRKHSGENVNPHISIACHCKPNPELCSVFPWRC